MLVFSLAMAGVLAAIALQAVAVWLLARSLSLPRPQLWRAVVLLLVQGLVNLSCAWLGADGSLARAGVLLAGQLVITIVLLRVLFGGTRRQTAALYGCMLVLTFVTLAGTQVFFRPMVAEAFVSPANSMAPTLLGFHRVGVCPQCGGAMIVSAAGGPDNPDGASPQVGEEDGICMTCRHMAKVTPAEPVGERDRFWVDKLRTPERWDVIVFILPPQPNPFNAPAPEVKYVKRLIGLPGETVYVDQGKVWVNGQPLEPPAALAGQTYESPDGFGTMYARPDNPLKLGPDEYFVLGDFSRRSADSRFWGPVPKANYIGVVVGRYWPLSRFGFWK